MELDIDVLLLIQNNTNIFINLKKHKHYNDYKNNN